MSDIYKGLTVKLGVDDTSLSKALRSAKNEAAGVYGELRKLDKALRLDPGNTKLLAQQQTDYRRQIESTEKQLKILKQAESEIGKENMDSDQWVKLQSDIVMAEQKLRGYKQALAETIIEQNVANSTLGKVGGAVERFGGKVEGIGRGMQSVGGALTRTLTPAIIAAGTATVIAATDIDTGLTNVKKTVDGTAEQYGELKQAAIDFSQTNAVSARQILDIQALGAQLGFSIDELDEFGRVVSGLDIATNMDAEQAATEMAQFANITKMSHGEISNYGSAIVGLGNNFATTESDISAMAMRIAAAGTQVGMNQADILGLATALTSLGVEAEAGGTAVSTIMAQIDKDIALNSNNVATWASAAKMDASTFADAWKNDPVEALSALLAGMESTTAEGGNMSVMLEDLGIDSNRQTDIMKRLAGNSELVGNAVSKSNGEWTKNTALQKEVDNRNESLAAQFEMLKNRVIAVADQVGGPLAAALLDAIDAAEPLIKLIADGAKSFAEMSKEEQKAVLQAVALSAAIGPVLSIFGKGLQQVEGFGRGLQNLAKFFATVDYNSSEAGRAAAKYEKEAAKAAKSADSQAASVKASSVAMGVAKTAAAGLALAGIALLVTAIADYSRKQSEFNKATDGLSDSLGSMNTAFLNTRNTTLDAVGSSDEYVMSLSEVKTEVDEVIAKQGALADSVKESFEAAGSDIGLLESYKSVIGDLAGKSDLTAQKQAELSLAIDGVNGMCGTNYEVVKDAGGAYVIMRDGAAQAKDAILDLIEAQEIQIRFDAGKSAYEDSYKNLAGSAKAAADATATYNSTIEKHDENIKKITDAGGDYAHALITVTAREDEAREVMERAIAANDSAVDATKRLKDEQVLLTQAMSEGKGSVSDYVASNDFLMASLSGAGKSCLDFTSTLEGVGANTVDLGKLNEEQLSTIASSYDGTYSSIAGLLAEYGVGVDAAKVNTQNAFDGMKRSMNLYSDDVKLALFNAGMSSEDFVSKLAGAGVSTEDFRSLSSDQLALLVSTYDGNINLTKAKLDEFVKKNGEAGANGASSFANSLSSGSAQAVIAATELTGQTLAQFEADCSKYGIKGDSAVSAYATAILNGATPAEAAAIAVGTAGASGADQSAKFDISAQSSLGAFNATLSRASGSRDAGTVPAYEAAAGMQSQNKNASTWGEHLGGNFASGIRGAIGWVSNAATSLADAVWKVLGHTVPKEGPLRNGGKGEAEWGRHTVQNYISGVRSQIPELKKAMNEVANTASMPLASSESIRLSTAATVSARKQSAPVVSVSVDGKDGITKSDVYDAMVAAINTSSGGKEVALYVDGKKFASTTAGHFDAEFADMEVRRNR